MAATAEQLRRNHEVRVARTAEAHGPEILRLHEEGLTRIQVAEQLGLDRRVVGGVVAVLSPKPVEPRFCQCGCGQAIGPTANWATGHHLTKAGRAATSNPWRERAMEEPMAATCGRCQDWRAEGSARDVIDAYAEHRERCTGRRD